MTTIKNIALRVRDGSCINADIASPAIFTSVRASIRVLTNATSYTTCVNVDVVSSARSEVTCLTRCLKSRFSRTVSSIHALGVDVRAVAWAVITFRAARLIRGQRWTVFRW